MPADCTLGAKTSPIEAPPDTVREYGQFVEVLDDISLGLAPSERPRFESRPFEHLMAAPENPHLRIMKRGLYESEL